MHSQHETTTKEQLKLWAEFLTRELLLDFVDVNYFLSKTIRQLKNLVILVVLSNELCFTFLYSPVIINFHPKSRDFDLRSFSQWPHKFYYIYHKKTYNFVKIKLYLYKFTLKILIWKAVRDGNHNHLHFSANFVS